MEIFDVFYKEMIGQSKITIGMIGYPNVGKSSLINLLVGKKMVGVDHKPGKTKNF